MKIPHPRPPSSGLAWFQTLPSEAQFSVTLSEGRRKPGTGFKTQTDRDPRALPPIILSIRDLGSVGPDVVRLAQDDMEILIKFLLNISNGTKRIQMN